MTVWKPKDYFSVVKWPKPLFVGQKMHVCFLHERGRGLLVFFLVSAEILVLFLWVEFDSYSSEFDDLNGK